MNKKIKVCKKEKEIIITMNKKEICTFKIAKNKIDGKNLFEKLDVKKEDVFIIEDCGIKKDSSQIDDVVVLNTQIFLERLIFRINETLKNINDKVDD